MKYQVNTKLKTVDIWEEDIKSDQDKKDLATLKTFFRKQGYKVHTITDFEQGLGLQQQISTSNMHKYTPFNPKTFKL